MNARIKNRLSMYRTVISVCDKVSADMQSIPALWSKYNEFKDMVDELDKMIQVQLRNIKGIAVDKQESRNKLIGLLLNASAAIKSYAADSRDGDLYATAHYTYSDLRNMRSEAMYEVAVILYGLVELHAAELPQYGYTPAMLSELSDAIADYKDRVEAPTEARKMRKVYTKKISMIDKDIRVILKTSIDNSMVILGYSKPLIEEKYKSARRIYNYRGRNKDGIEEADTNAVIMGEVYDMASLPLADALVRIENSTVHTYTDNDGVFLLEVPAGRHNIVVTKEGYAGVRENNVVVDAGESLERGFVLGFSATPGVEEEMDAA